MEVSATIFSLLPSLMKLHKRYEKEIWTLKKLQSFPFPEFSRNNERVFLFSSVRGEATDR